MPNQPFYSDPAITGHGKSADRRPWLILSRSEVEVLLERCEHDQGDADLDRVRNVIRRQLAWIDGDQLNGQRPSVQRALDS